MDVRAKLAGLRRAVEQARSMPMSASAVVNRGEMLGMIDSLEGEMDTAFGEAERVLRDREEIIADARTEARHIVEDAQRERDDLVSDTEVFRLAQHRAGEVLESARAEAEGLRAEIDDYVDGKLATFEITLERTIEAVRRGRERLAGGSALDSLTRDEADKIELPEHLEG